MDGRHLFCNEVLFASKNHFNLSSYRKMFARQDRANKSKRSIK